MRPERKVDINKGVTGKKKDINTGVTGKKKIMWISTQVDRKEERWILTQAVTGKKKGGCG